MRNWINKLLNKNRFLHPYDLFDYQAHLHNSNLFLKLWKERVTPELVIKDLSSWDCGTQACAGGHMATWKEFHAIGGFKYSKTPTIRISNEYTCSGINVAKYLFRNRHLFSSRGDCIFKDYDDAYYPGRAVSDYDLVIKRFENWIKFLKDKISDSLIVQRTD